MVAEVISKESWKDGKYPTRDGLHYRTRQIKFRSDEGIILRINVKSHIPTSIKYNSLKIGDRIVGFSLLKPGIIDCESDFTIYHKGSLF